VSILFFISGHGFGHASRQVEVINALGARTSAPLVIRTAASATLLDRTLRVPCARLPGDCDTGVVQKTSIEQDDAATVDAAIAFYASFDARVDAEVRRVAPIEPRLIVGDIAPLAFTVASRLGVPSVAIGNFTWDWIYEAHPGFLPRGAAVLARIRDAYRQATLALELPFAGGFEVFSAARRIPLIARRPRRSREDTRAHFGLPADRLVALLSFGGYGLPHLDLSQPDWTDRWTVVTTDRLPHDGVPAAVIRVLGDDPFPGGAFAYEDLVAAVDVVISKPGYGIVSECIAARTALVYTSRGTFREYDVFVDEMPAVLPCRYLPQRDLLAGRWREALDAVVARIPAVGVDVSGADVAAELIADLAIASSR
jgi:L-arabinokinase